MKPQLLFESAVQKQLANDLAGAKLAYQKLLRQFPTNSEVLSNLAAILRREGQQAAAEQLLERSLRANGRNVAALATLANLRIQQKRLDDAYQIACRALEVEPNYPEALVNLGTVFARRNQLKNAEITFRRVLALAPNNAAAQINMANLMRLNNMHLEESISQLQAVIAREPSNDEALAYLCLAHNDRHEYVKALEAMTRAHDVSRKPEYIGSMAAILITIGEFEEAMNLYKDMLKIEPGNVAVAATLLFALNYDHRRTAEEVFEEYRKYGLTLRAPHRMEHKDHPKVEGRKIRVGYASADYYAHVVMFFMEPILNAHDHNDFEYFAYSNTTRSDHITERVKKHFDHWVDVSNMTHEEMAQKVKEDGIDILVDLSGHTTGTRLEAMAFRPAPVQATYLGYGYTTGMSEIDYFIGDENFTPEGCEHLFSERICRVPAPVYAYEAPVGKTPDVAPLPCIEKGYVTFGSMSRIIRFNNRLLRVWKQILDRVPGSKLRLDQKPFGDHDTRERFIARLEKLGYHRDQLELVSTQPHWNGYHHFDISLDCWPHNAGTTTFEALWMGVPVVSKRDRPSVGRLSEMVLSPLGLSDWVVDTEEQFVEKAVALASDIPALEVWRASLRERLHKSQFTNYRGRAKGLEDAYRQMMRTFEEENA